MVKQVQKDLEALVNVLKGHWMQGAMCDGWDTMSKTVREGACFCLTGAAARVVYNDPYGYTYTTKLKRGATAIDRRFSTLIEALYSVLPLKGKKPATDNQFCSIMGWNDKVDRTERGVLALVKRAQVAVA